MELEGRLMPSGVVTWFDSGKGFGFITPDAGGPEVFVEYTELVGEGFRTVSGWNTPSPRLGGDPKRTRCGPASSGRSARNGSRAGRVPGGRGWGLRLR